jgi:hypothetical protein
MGVSMGTSCRQETRYLVTRNMRIRGFEVEIKHEDSFVGRTQFGEFELTIMPGNRRVLISQHSLIYPEHRDKGYGKKYLEMREEIARASQCNLLLATVRGDNAVEIHLLKSHGWIAYNSRDTGVSLWGKEL